MRKDGKSTVVSIIDQWIGNMFYRGQPINVIDELSYSDLKYFAGWHEVMVKAEKNIIKDYKRNA